MVMGVVKDEVYGARLRPLLLVDDGREWDDNDGMDLEDYLTTRQAWELAKELADAPEDTVSQQAITDAARSGKIEGAQKMWDNEKAPWIFSRDAFEFWLKNRKPRGRPRKSEKNGV
jgi:hypothetical protein